MVIWNQQIRLHYYGVMWNTHVAPINCQKQNNFGVFFIDIRMNSLLTQDVITIMNHSHCFSVKKNEKEITKEKKHSKQQKANKSVDRMLL